MFLSFFCSFLFSLFLRITNMTQRLLGTVCFPGGIPGCIDGSIYSSVPSHHQQTIFDHPLNRLHHSFSSSTTTSTSYELFSPTLPHNNKKKKAESIIDESEHIRKKPKIQQKIDYTKVPIEF